MTQKRLGVTAVVEVKDQLLGIITDGDLRRMLRKSTKIDETITAADIMSIQPKTISADALAIEALDVLRKNGITQIAVVDKDTYLGIIHLHDLIREGLI